MNILYNIFVYNILTTLINNISIYQQPWEISVSMIL